jgi:hypothetical protein
VSWSDGGDVLFLGFAKWDGNKAGRAGRARGRRGCGRRTQGRQVSGGTGADTEAPTVEVWHWKDEYVMPWQKIHASADRRRNMLATWHLDSGRFVPLGDDPIEEQVTPIRHTGFAWIAEWSKYAMNRSIGRPAADLYLADVATGERTKLKDAINDRYVQAGPSGKYLLFLQDDHYWTINLGTRAITNITRAVPTSFIDKESDQAIKQKPPFGVAGWTKDDAAVLLYDKFDVWQVPVDGSKAVRLTGGLPEQVRFRLVRLDPDEEWIDLGKAVYLSVYGDRTKKTGYAMLKPGGNVDRLVWLDKNVGSLAKAKDADVYVYIVQDYDDSPDVFVSDANLRGARQVTTTNPFQGKFAWGRSELIEYKTDAGRTLQGALYYPAGYEPGKQYPMIVYMYELLSQNVHRYVAPADRDYYNTSVFTSQGYFVLQPDIVFTTRQPGVSVAQCVTAGVRKVIQMGAWIEARRRRRAFDGRIRLGILATHTTACSPRQLPARRLPIWSATTAITTGVRASRKPITSKPGSSGWKCRSTRISPPTSGTRRCSTCRT